MFILAAHILLLGTTGKVCGLMMDQMGQHAALRTGIGASRAPGLGTAIGGAIGGLIGGVGGYFAGSSLAIAIFNLF